MLDILRWGGYNVICDIICVYVFFEGMDKFSDQR